jgi:CubicO group peptidase (beta-lactamase class C family)
MDPNLLRWRTSRGEEAGASGMPMMKRLDTPLVFEPGTNFAYGTSLDWAGVLIARLNNKSLEAYMEEHIWGPLGIKNMTFHQELKPDVKKNLVTMAKREDGEVLGVALKDSGARIVWTDEKLYDDPTEDEWGGAGGIGSAVEFIKILNSINADDGKLLKSETIDLMFTPQLNDETRRGFEAFVGFSAAYEMFTSHEPGTSLDYGIGGMLVLSHKGTGLKSGTLSWSGLPNLLWTIDRKSGLSLFYASNLVPFGDQKAHKMQQLFEKEMYTRFSKLQGKL